MVLMLPRRLNTGVCSKRKQLNYPSCEVQCAPGLGLSPLEFNLYMEDEPLDLERHNIKHHLFVDDKQAHSSAPLQGVDDGRNRLHDCTTDISN